MAKIKRCLCDNKQCCAVVESVKTKKTYCMWYVEDRLIELANDKTYGMCPVLREKVLNNDCHEVDDNEWE